MPNTHETLGGLFSDIADAIRAKTGDTADIVADNFPSAIAAIPSVTVEPLSVTENGTYTASSGVAYNPVTVNVNSGALTKIIQVSSTISTLSFTDAWIAEHYNEIKGCTVTCQDLSYAGYYGQTLLMMICTNDGNPNLMYVKNHGDDGYGIAYRTLYRNGDTLVKDTTTLTWYVRISSDGSVYVHPSYNIPTGRVYIAFYL